MKEVGFTTTKISGMTGAREERSLEDEVEFLVSVRKASGVKSLSSKVFLEIKSSRLGAKEKRREDSTPPR